MVDSTVFEMVEWKVGLSEGSMVELKDNWLVR